MHRTLVFSSQREHESLHSEIHQIVLLLMAAEDAAQANGSFQRWMLAKYMKLQIET